MGLYLYEKYNMNNKQRLFEVMQKVNPDFRVILNEDVLEEGWFKNLAMGVLISAASSLGSSAQASNTQNQLNNQNIETVQNQTQNQVYASIVGMAHELSTIAKQNRQINVVGAFKEISIYYENLRDNVTPRQLSTEAKKYLKILNQTFNEKTDVEIKYLINLGMGIHHN